MGSHAPVSTSSSSSSSCGLASTRHYHPGVCHFCLASPPHPLREPLRQPLMRCSQCHLVVYCSRRCQKKDWQKHKDLCRVNKLLDGMNVFSRGKEVVTAGGRWDHFRTGLSVAAALNLKRRLHVHEEETFLFPRVCEVCRDSNQEKLASCPNCFSVFYCSSEHRDQDEERHALYCNHYLLLLECDRVEATNGIQDLPFPVDVDDNYRNLPDKLMTLVRPQLERSATNASLDPKIVSMITERLSYPLSLLYALQNVGIGPDNTALHVITDLRVHVVGATSYTEMLGIIRWEYMAHRLPALRTLHITFVGPQLFAAEDSDEELVTENYILDDSGLTMCDHCQSRERRIVYEMANMCYHEFVDSEHYRAPDVIAAFNCGFHEYAGNNNNNTAPSNHQSAGDTSRHATGDTWRASLPLLAAQSSTPLVLTSYTEDEASLDLMTLQRAVPVKVLLEPHLNPYHSLRPYRSHEEKPIHFWNQFITCVRGTC